MRPVEAFVTAVVVAVAVAVAPVSSIVIGAVGFFAVAVGCIAVPVAADMAVAEAGARDGASTVAGAVVLTPAALRREAGVVDGTAANALRWVAEGEGGGLDVTVGDPIGCDGTVVGVAVGVAVGSAEVVPGAGLAPVPVACAVVFEERAEVSSGGMAGAANPTAKSIAKATIPAAMNPRSMSLSPMRVRWR